MHVRNQFNSGLSKSDISHVLEAASFHALYISDDLLEKKKAEFEKFKAEI